MTERDISSMTPVSGSVKAKRHSQSVSKLRAKILAT